MLNIVLVASYEFITITAYIYVFILIVLMCVEIENPTWKLVSEFIPIFFVIGWFINAYTIERPQGLF